MSTRTACLLLLVVLGATPAFSVEPVRLPRAASERIEFVAWDGVRISGRDVARSERFLARVERKLGHRITGLVEFHRVTMVSQVDALTGVFATGATRFEDGRIYSTRSYHPHELVHRVALELGDPGRFFHEGLAVALAGEPGWKGRDLRERARAALARRPFQVYRTCFESLPREDAYAVAGAFVAFLIDRHGTRRMADFFRACGSRGGRSSQAYASVFGSALEADAAAWVARL